MAEAKKTQTAAAPGVTVDPYRAYYFKIYIGGTVQGGFTQCSDFGIRVDCIRYAEGGDVVERKVQGRVHYDDVTLQYGLSDSLELWAWMQSVVAGPTPTPRKNLSIVVMDAAGTTEKVHWTLYNAWPVYWRAAPLNTMSSMVAIETLELCYEHLDRQ